MVCIRLVKSGRGVQLMGKVGVIFSALMVLVVAALALLFGALATHIAISTGIRTGDLDLFAILATIALIGFGGWGIASAVGIVKMRKWARISILAFGAISLAVAILGTAKMVLDPAFGISYLEGVYMGSIRAEIMALLAWLAGLGGFWLYFFNRSNIKARFSR